MDDVAGCLRHGATMAVALDTKQVYFIRLLPRNIFVSNNIFVFINAFIPSNMFIPRNMFVPVNVLVP